MRDRWGHRCVFGDVWTWGNVDECQERVWIGPRSREPVSGMACAAVAGASVCDTPSRCLPLSPLPPHPARRPQEAMFGEEEAGQPHSNKEAAVLIAYEAVSTGLLTDMVSYLGMLEFESRKDLVAIFGALVRIEHSGEFPGMNYILDHDAILATLFDGWAGRGAHARRRRLGCATVPGCSDAAAWLHKLRVHSPPFPPHPLPGAGTRTRR